MSGKGLERLEDTCACGAMPLGIQFAEGKYRPNDELDNVYGAVHLATTNFV